MNTEYTIIPISIPDDDLELIKVSNIAFNIWERDDETERLIDTMKKEQEILKRVVELYHWTGKIDFVYGASTAGGLGDKKSAEKANKRIMEELSGLTRVGYWRR